MAADPQLVEAIMEVLADPMNLPSTFWDYATQSWLKDAPVFPISQVFGFVQFTALSAPVVITTETIASGVYGDLATVGPTLTGLPDGQYLIIFGALVHTSAAGIASLMSVQPNSTLAVDSDALQSQAVDPVSCARAITKSLSNNGSNTLTAKYRSGGTGTYSNRWLLALKYANL